MTEFGATGKVTAQIMRRRAGSMTQRDDDEDETYDWLKGFHGTPPQHSWHFGDRWGRGPGQEFMKSLEVVAEAGRNPPTPTAWIDLVRVPMDHPQQGVVVGRTVRYSGRVVSLGYDEGYGWVAGPGQAVYTVALETDGPSRLVDVAEEDLR